MTTLIEELRDKIPYEILTDTEVKNVLATSAHSRYGLIKRAIAEGKLIHLRRGLYAFGKRYQCQSISTFELAQNIYAPSYVSLESALSFHGLIPEGVPTVTSACLKRSREFSTPFGMFSFSRIPWFNFIGVDRIQSDGSSFLMADPAKALVDYVYIYKKDWIDSNPLLTSLRIEQDDLTQISQDTLHDLLDTYQSKRVQKFIRGLMGDLKT